MFPFFSTDWEHEKGFYLDSVNKHISGNQGGRQGRDVGSARSSFPRMFLFSHKDKVLWQHDGSLAELNELLQLPSGHVRNSLLKFLGEM